MEGGAKGANHGQQRCHETRYKFLYCVVTQEHIVVSGRTESIYN